MMACGHAPNGKDTKTGGPVCVICQCDKFLPIDPDLAGREAECIMCTSKQTSNVKLPFFNYLYPQNNDRFYCGCRGWD